MVRKQRHFAYTFVLKFDCIKYQFLIITEGNTENKVITGDKVIQKTRSYRRQGHNRRQYHTDGRNKLLGTHSISPFMK